MPFALLAEFRVERKLVAATLVGLFTLFHTLKKPMLNRTFTFSWSLEPLDRPPEPTGYSKGSC